MKLKLYILVAVIALLGGVIGVLLGWSSIKPVKRNFIVKARQYSYNPSKISVNKGDTLIFKLVSLDVVHGFFMEGYDVDAQISPNLKTIKVRHPSAGFNWKDTSAIYFIANKTGKYRYRCSHTCGTLHPFMQGEMVVNPNSLFHAGLGGVIGFVLGMFLMIYFRVLKREKNKRDVQ